MEKLFVDFLTAEADVTLMVAPAPRGAGLDVRRGAGTWATLEHPIECAGVDGSLHRSGYDHIASALEGRWTGTAQWRHGDATIRVSDTWEPAGDALTLHRRIRATGPAPEHPDGFRLRLAWSVPSPGPVRLFVPGLIYAVDQYTDGREHSYADHRLAYPLVAAHQVRRGEVIVLKRLTPATFDQAPEREPGQRAFIQRTDIGSVGFSTEPETLTLSANWPYHEGETSAMLDRQGTPATAHFPVDGEDLDITIRYRLWVDAAKTFSTATHRAFSAALAAAAPEPTALPVPLRDSIEVRLDSAAATYRESDDGFAGFALNFDPRHGFGSHPLAFGASFAEHRMGRSEQIFEYGFTGRQLNVAYMLARHNPDAWSERAARVVDAFVDRMCTASGWMYTLWDTGRKRPLYACGDPTGPVMHYLGRSSRPGTYSRMMAEAGSDLLLNISLYNPTTARPSWWDACLRLADFFVRYQDDDGAWYRAYTPDGDPVTGGEWFGTSPAAGKTATSTVVPFLLAVARQATGCHPEAARRYRDAAIRAGEYVLRHSVALDDYRGGTLDNPNVVDKEAAFLVMSAALALHEATGESRWLDAARRSATQAVTWHSIWTVPNIDGTEVATAGVRSVGWGGINSIWGAGVTDIYSLFFAADLVRLARLADDQLFARVAQLIAHSSVQLLSVPERSYGFADIGMQPEGISFCDQGADDGLIRKGDTWGGLAWPYSAGTFGMAKYLDACAEPAPHHQPLNSPIVRK
ncbi:hypothetical protein [Jiangella asiatica]|uniref:Uncharacterized protein n=1 Tax=Jiangella asiatica TaxID=2530372 RepID=A0A4V2Z290_9ACTN|nr:hypothetical protein [Jiangella asiatica]TDE07918.1 hypothetical protein E1269_19325 [Jiangella asiatica]